VQSGLRFMDMLGSISDPAEFFPGDSTMASSAFAAYAIYPETVGLKDVLRTLGQGGFTKESICLVLSPTHPIATIMRDSSTRFMEREVNTATAELIGWLSELGAVVIPIFGFFIRSREFFRTLVEEKNSNAPSGTRGVLVSLGLSEEAAARIDGRIREGGVFLYVSCPETQTQWALELLRASETAGSGLLQPEVAMAAAAGESTRSYVSK
jgi:hypothetical protein